MEEGRYPDLFFSEKLSLIIPSELLLSHRWEEGGERGAEKLISSVFSLGNPNLNRPDAGAGLVRVRTLPQT